MTPQSIDTPSSASKGSENVSDEQGNGCFFVLGMTDSQRGRAEKVLGDNKADNWLLSAYEKKGTTVNSGGVFRKGYGDN